MLPKISLPHRDNRRKCGFSFLSEGNPPEKRFRTNLVSCLIFISILKIIIISNIKQIKTQETNHNGFKETFTLTVKTTYIIYSIPTYHVHKLTNFRFHLFIGSGHARFETSQDKVISKDPGEHIIIDVSRTLAVYSFTKK